MNDRTNLACILLISGLSSSKRGRLWKQSFQAYFDDAKDSSQESRFKQVSRIKESFKSRIKIQVKTQKKTQDMQELQEKHQDKYKKIFSKEKIE